MLVLAAVLKLHGLAFSPVSPAGIFSSSSFQVAAIQLEIALGLWLLWGKNPIGAWLAALGLFGLFAGASLYQALTGQTSCGCFGSLRVHTWYTFGLDVVVLGALCVGRPDLAPMRQDPGGTLRRLAMTAGGALVGVAAFIALFAGAAGALFGSTEAALARLRGERISVRPSLVDLGSATAGESRETAVELVNWTDRPIRVFGGSADCSCSVTRDLPVVIPPGESRSVSVNFGFPASPGDFTRSAWFYADDGAFRTVRFRLTGRALGPEAVEDGSESD